MRGFPFLIPETRMKWAFLAMSGILGRMLTKKENGDIFVNRRNNFVIY